MTAAMLMLGCAEHASGPTAPLRTIYAPRHATGFAILEDTVSRHMVLRITNPYQGAEQYSRDLVIEHPFRRIATFSSSHVAMLDTLGCADRIVGISGLRYIISPSVRLRADQDLVREIGYDSAVEMETIRAMGTEIALMYGVDGTNSRLEAKLDEAGIRYVYIGDYVEEDPLGKAEWIVAMAAMCGNTERGIEKFRAIESRYLGIRERTAGLKERPRIMVNAPYRDSWYMPSRRSYMVRLIEDAGGAYMYCGKDVNVSTPISTEEAMILVSSCDIWINTGQITTLDELRQQCPLFAEMDVVLNGQVYNSNRIMGPGGGSGFWEGGAVNPDLVLNDLHTIFSHGDLSTLTFYRQLQ